MACCKNVCGPTGGSGGTPGGDGGDDRPRRFTAAEKGKGKVLAKKRKASDCEEDVARAVAVAAVEAGGRSGSLRIRSELMAA